MGDYIQNFATLTKLQNIYFSKPQWVTTLSWNCSVLLTSTSATRLLKNPRTRPKARLPGASLQLVLFSSFPFSACFWNAEPIMILGLCAPSHMSSGISWVCFHSSPKFKNFVGQILCCLLKIFFSLSNYPEMT